jgi:glucuronate isomerase
MAARTFISDLFLLETDAARELYSRHAAPAPIYDYHCHLPAQQVANDQRFTNLAEIWLGGDHYKWRAMRANGVPEEFCTGAAPDRAKFDAFVRTMPYLLRNPIYHWSHLELLRYFEIDLLINEANADAIWDQANDRLKEGDFSAGGILEKFRVAVIGTTDDPAESLDFHETIRRSGLATRVYPTYRPDKVFTVHSPEVFNAWRQKLAAASGVDCDTFAGLLDALKKRHDDFHALGGRLSDHGLEACFDAECTDSEARSIFDRVTNGTAASPEETEKFGAWMMRHFGQMDAELGWTKQLHLGALRNNNTRQVRALGPDTGYDSISDVLQARSLGRYLDRLESSSQLPKMVLYNLNPADNYVIATMAGNFQSSDAPGKIQWGSGWWFLDQKEGMEWQLNALSQLGLLRRFVGMVTDSRSFLSYTRHEYFRRILCNLIGGDIEKGLLPDDMALAGAMVREICFENARTFFGQDVSKSFLA